MHTIQVQIDDNLYNKVVKNGVDLKEKFNEFLQWELFDDGYLSIGTEEARDRVNEAVTNYKSGKTETVSHSDTWTVIDEKIKSQIN